MQITPTFDPGDDGIWSEIDLLEGDPVHRGVAMRERERELVPSRK